MSEDMVQVGKAFGLPSPSSDAGGGADKRQQIERIIRERSKCSFGCDATMRYDAWVSDASEAADAILRLFAPTSVTSRPLPLNAVIEWYQTLPKPARERLSLANLHALAKALPSAASDRAERAEQLLIALNAAIDEFWNADPRDREPQIKALTMQQLACFEYLKTGPFAPKARSTAPSSSDGEGAQQINEVDRKPTCTNTCTNKGHPHAR